MLTLGVHTAGPACDIALADGELILTATREEMARGQDAKLAGLVKTLFETAGREIGSLDRIGVVVGPGSFTGIRVGTAFARGLALATGATCVGVTSLEAALPAGQQGSAIVLLPAQRRPPDITYWAQKFRSGEATGTPEELSLDAVLDLLQAHPHMIYGDADALVAAGREITVHSAQPSAERAALLAQCVDANSHPPSPTYVRAPDAALPSGQR